MQASVVNVVGRGVADCLKRIFTKTLLLSKLSLIILSFFQKCIQPLYLLSGNARRQVDRLVNGIFYFMKIVFAVLAVGVVRLRASFWILDWKKSPTSGTAVSLKNHKLYIETSGELLTCVVTLLLETHPMGLSLSALKTQIKKRFHKKLSEATFGDKKMIELFRGATLAQVVSVVLHPGDPKKGFFIKLRPGALENSPRVREIIAGAGNTGRYSRYHTQKMQTMQAHAQPTMQSRATDVSAAPMREAEPERTGAGTAVQTPTQMPLMHGPNYYWGPGSVWAPWPKY